MIVLQEDDEVLVENLEIITGGDESGFITKRLLETINPGISVTISSHRIWSTKARGYTRTTVVRVFKNLVRLTVANAGRYPLHFLAAYTTKSGGYIRTDRIWKKHGDLYTRVSSGEHVNYLMAQDLVRDVVYNPIDTTLKVLQVEESKK